MSIRRLSPARSLTAAFRLLLAGALIVCSPLHARDDALDISLREAVHSVPVAAARANIVVTSFRPEGNGPFPWIVLSHGSATTAQANRAIGRNRIHSARSSRSEQGNRHAQIGHPHRATILRIDGRDSHALCASDDTRMDDHFAVFLWRSNKLI